MCADETKTCANGCVVKRFTGVQPDRTQICRLVHLQPGRPAHERWFDLVDQLLGELSHLARPRGIYRVERVVELTPRRVELESGTTFHGAVGSFLKHSTHIAMFVSTIGSAVERLSRGWLKAGKIMQGTIADAIASETAEATAQAVQDDVQAWAQSQGWNITPRYSPGYCGLHVRQQKSLFARVPAGRINVRLKPSCLMIPVKSVSGLIGIGPADKVAPAGYPCEHCTHPDCMQRRAPMAPYAGTCQDWGEFDESCRTSTT